MPRKFRLGVLRKNHERKKQASKPVDEDLPLIVSLPIQCYELAIAPSLTAFKHRIEALNILPQGVYMYDVWLSVFVHVLT